MHNRSWAATRFGMTAIGSLSMAVTAAQAQKARTSASGDNPQGALNAWRPPV